MNQGSPNPCTTRAAFKFIGAALGATPTQLGQITLSRALVQAASSPMAGLLGDRLDRVHLVATGCLLWAACTAAIGMSTTLTQVRAAAQAKLKATQPLTGLLRTELGYRLLAVSRVHRRHRHLH